MAEIPVLPNVENTLAPQDAVTTGSLRQVMRSLPNDVSFGKPSRRGSLLGSIVKNALVLIVLILLTITALYWQTIVNEINYRLIQKNKPAPAVETSTPNGLFAGNQTSYQAQDSHLSADQPIIPQDNRLVISKIGVNAPIVDIPTYNDADVLKSIQQGAGRYADTGIPGQPGNVVLTGHSSYWWWDPGKYKFIFQHLEDLQVGDIITIYYNQVKYDYKVSNKQVVKPSGPHVDAIFDQAAYQDNPILRILTCTPVGTALNRLVVTAEQISPTPKKAAATITH